MLKRVLMMVLVTIIVLVLIGGTALVFHYHDDIRAIASHFSGDSIGVDVYEVVIDQGLTIRAFPTINSPSRGTLSPGDTFAVSEVVYNNCHEWGRFGPGWVALKTGDIIFAEAKT